MKTKTYLSLLVGLGMSTTAVAQAPLDTAGLARTEVDAASCRSVEWHPDLLASYPRAATACHEVIMSGGERWARFETQLVRVNSDGSVRSSFRDRTGSNMGTITIMPARDQRVDIDGRQYRFSELRPGQVLNVYVPEGANSFALAPAAPVAERVRVVEIKPEPYVAPPVVASTRMLPSTAGPLPLLAIGGLLALLGGLGFTVRRRATAVDG